ncbi:hypothetical protein DSLPV1_220 [Dishui lake phycodnavirus 1]|uniref:hypothetical protein n=1 Tax=Dishui lake phycodnavirus 1 TaxID=2079134 RepID=UPI000CD6BDDE|nr:hypothetical protein C5Y57_gp178 [Dishui lake phycodnavirus 1]AUT19191.1 hypothetical protein DSLPV1_220 [Dishui lake phycodnavirus 1]
MLGSLDWRDTRPVAIQMKELHSKEVAARAKYHRRCAEILNDILEVTNVDKEFEVFRSGHDVARSEYDEIITAIEKSKTDLRLRRKEEKGRLSKPCMTQGP